MNIIGRGYHWFCVTEESTWGEGIEDCGKTSKDVRSWNIDSEESTREDVGCGGNMDSEESTREDVGCGGNDNVEMDVWSCTK